ncbi:MAG: hypothetical protein LQ350_008674 [Teloschistes chrysophthalmus]|nr:MAG: hypothetical protein LQ350_008674 [Niorma chrysophthalma]
MTSAGQTQLPPADLSGSPYGKMAQALDPERDAADTHERGPPKLIKFRHMTGIDTPPTLHNRDRQRAARNLGIYTRIVSEERKATWQYHTMSTVINASFLGQILVAASLTALGAIGGPSLAITILGSANTIIAGIQTYLKGQGLPNRMKQYQFGLRKLREYIEDRERDFSSADCKLDVDHVIADVSAMYQAVRQTAEDNTPDTYLPMEGAGKKLLGQKDNRVTAIDQLGAPPYQDRSEVGMGGNDDGVSEQMDGKDVKDREAGAKSTMGLPAPESSGDAKKPKPNSQVAVNEDSENTPLLKHRES